MTHIGRAQDGMKRCARCRETKATTHFNRVKRPRGDYWNAWCKPCANEYAKIRERNKRYGITSAQYDAIWAQQGGRCAICDEAEGKRQLRPRDGRDPRAALHALQHGHRSAAR